MFPIKAKTRLEAWVKGTEYLIDNGPSLNIVLSIRSPGSDGSRGIEAQNLFDKFYEAENEPPVHTVAETIFPAWTYRRRGMAGLEDFYIKEEYPLLRKGDSRSWGVYAERLIRRTTPDGKVIKPLQMVISKMKSELEKARAGPFRSCYELGVTDVWDIALYRIKDQKRRRGAPCLSHLSFKLFDKAVHLTALYRSHDYWGKVPGNLLGLARLQACVANEVGIKIGTMVVHSSYAFLRQGKAKRNLKALVADVRDCICREGDV